MYLIAEIGINHNGSLQTAFDLIDEAVIAGWDAVKFQKRTIDKVYTKEFLESPRESQWGTTQRAQKEGLEFGEREYDEIYIYCKSKKIDWSASAWDLESQKFLQKYNLPWNKISSAMLPCIDLLKMVAKEGKLTYISTAMSTIKMIDDAVAIFRENGCPFILNHCVAQYPLQPENAYLFMIHYLKQKYGCLIGYSGHEIGNEISRQAALMGVVAIERHITLDRKMPGSDQSSSIEPEEMYQLAKIVKEPFLKDILDYEKPVAEKLRAHILEYVK